MIIQGDGSWQRAIDAGLCPRCHSSGTVEVHGHVQCSVCKLYVNECCSGETSTATSSLEQEDGKDNEADKAEAQEYCAYGNL
jgi:hypothetical protein